MNRFKYWHFLSFLLLFSLSGCYNFDMYFSQSEMIGKKIERFDPEIKGIYKAFSGADNEVKSLLIGDSTIVVPRDQFLALIDFLREPNIGAFTPNFDAEFSGDGLMQFTFKSYDSLNLFSGDVLLTSDDDAYYVNLKDYSNGYGWKVIQFKLVKNKILRVTFLDKVKYRRKVNKFFDLVYIDEYRIQVARVKKPYEKLIKRGYFRKTEWMLRN
jgi:hypothetical protein